MFFKLQNTVFLNEQVHLSYRFFLKYSKLNSMSIAKVKLFVCVLLYITMTNFIYSQSVKVSRYGFQINQSKALRDAFNSSFDTLVIDKQDRPWVIDPMRFIDVRNKVIIFEEGVEVLAKKNAFSKKGDALLSFRNCQNIQLLGNGAKLKMNKIEYTDGEWRHGISLWNCRDIYIERLLICDSGGDGIFIDGTVSGSYSENIEIREIVATNNKRQGMSIVSAKNVSVHNSIFENTIGTLPGAGVDLEPDSKEDRLEQILFVDCIFRNNDHAGISLSLKQLESDSRPVSIVFKNCVLQNNHNKTNRYIASEIVLGAHNTRPVKGSVLFDSCLIENSNWGLFYSRKTSDAYKVEFRDCSARNICKDASYSAMYLEVPDYYKGEFSLGGYHFENLTIEYSSKVPMLTVRGSRLNTLREVADITGDIRLLSAAPKVYEYIKYDMANNNNVTVKINRKSSKKK